MPGHWTRATRLLECITLECGRSMIRGEAVYLAAGSERNPVCQPCALRRFEKTPPADLAPLPAPVRELPVPVRELSPIQQRLSDAVEPDEGAFARFDRARTGETLRKAIQHNRRQAAAAAAVDPKLRQLASGDR